MLHNISTPSLYNSIAPLDSISSDLEFENLPSCNHRKDAQYISIF